MRRRERDEMREGGRGSGGAGNGGAGELAAWRTGTAMVETVVTLVGPETVAEVEGARGSWATG